MKYTDLKPSDHGRYFSAVIGGILCKGRVKRGSSNEWLLCQNEYAGVDHRIEWGYKHSWCWYAGSDYNIKDFKFTHMTKEEIENYKDFKKGDKIKRPTASCKRVVIEELGEALFTKDLDETSAIRLFSSTEMYRNGWRLDVTPEEEEKPVVELSVAEIAKKLGLSPEQLKVVDK